MLRRWLPLLVTACLLAALASVIDTTRVVSLLRRVSPVLLVVAVLGTAASVLVSSLRYQIILRAMLTRSGSLKDIFAINLLSVFVAHFLPVAAAADGIRIALASLRFRLELMVAVESVLADRILALAGVCACVILALPLQAALHTPGTLVVLQLVACGAALAVTAVLLWAAARGAAPRWSWARRVALRIRNAGRHLTRATALRMQFMLALAGTLCFAGTLWVLSAGMGLRVTLLEALAFGPAIYLAQVLPFVYFGFGTREAATVLLLSSSGSVDADAAFSLGFAVGVCNMLIALPAPLVAWEMITQWRRSRAVASAG